MNFKDYLFQRLDEVNQQRASLNNNNTRLVWLNGQREILLSIIFDLENDNYSIEKNSNSRIQKKAE